jgi:hypothetical protein
VLVGPLRAVYSYNCYILPLVGSVSFGQQNKTYRTLVRNVIYFLLFLTWGSTNVTLVVNRAQVSTDNQLALNFKFWRHQYEFGPIFILYNTLWNYVLITCWSYLTMNLSHSCRNRKWKFSWKLSHPTPRVTAYIFLSQVWTRATKSETWGAGTSTCTRMIQAMGFTSRARSLMRIQVAVTSARTRP